MQALLAIHTVRLCGNPAAHSTGKMRMENAAASLLYLKTRPDMFPTQNRVWFNCLSADGFKPTRRPQSTHVNWASESSTYRIHPIQPYTIHFLLQQSAARASATRNKSNNAQQAAINAGSIAAAPQLLRIRSCSRASCNTSLPQRHTCMYPASTATCRHAVYMSLNMPMPAQLLHNSPTHKMRHAGLHAQRTCTGYLRNTKTTPLQSTAWHTMSAACWQYHCSILRPAEAAFWPPPARKNELVANSGYAGPPALHSRYTAHAVSLCAAGVCSSYCQLARGCVVCGRVTEDAPATWAAGGELLRSRMCPSQAFPCAAKSSV
jgi:hypothetical protein